MAVEPQPQPTEFTPARTATLFSKGIAMGLGDSVPGISGGTIAVITNIYDTLIFSIRAIDARALRLLVSGEIKESWRHINGSFLLTVALGMLVGLLVSANTVLYLLENQFVLLMAFFIGLVLASSFLLRQQINVKNPKQLLALAGGIALTAAVGFLEPVQTEPSLVYLFFCGAIAISAMILPGLSGAFILLLLGAYEHMLSALIAIELLTIVVFMAGCATGILAFSRLLAWMLRQYHQLSYSFIIGMLVGSLTVLWPWQQHIAGSGGVPGSEEGLHTGNVWPLNYTEITGQDPQLLAASAAIVAGFGVVTILHRLFTNKA